ncbi:hypothetical protein [Rubinisphaera sp.]|uniref:hypothetical protein n=1 Tax=Rubinisphaera sp. TaxID=2024857 RepID=UPI000C0E7FCB|nr:hypothetical protein [Rubinisphaera sp.]MBV07813.1 hypothetical protein [Rubinisphaera sp.]HCS53171.1 hypothetical protein [Planctomycetaceae bacterium]|tara:strand:+ start:977 stop:1684 length:708 start_codon:yes stop_codon:yes gene_type:complete
MPFELSSLSGLNAAFDFRGPLSGTVNDQAAAKTLSVNGTITKTTGLIGSGSRHAANADYYSTTDADLIGNTPGAFTRVFTFYIHSDYTAVTTRALNFYQSPDNNDRLQLLHNNAVFSSSPYLLLAANGTTKNTLISDSVLNQWLMLFVWSDGSVSTQFEVRSFSDFTQLAVNSLAVVQSSQSEMLYCRAVTAADCTFDNLLVFDRVLSDTEKESLWQEWRDQHNFLRGYRARIAK